MRFVVEVVEVPRPSLRMPFVVVGSLWWERS
jgi:hypothetical protein